MIRDENKIPKHWEIKKLGIFAKPKRDYAEVLLEVLLKRNSLYLMVIKFMSSQMQFMMI